MYIHTYIYIYYLHAPFTRTMEQLVIEFGSKIKHGIDKFRLHIL